MKAGTLDRRVTILRGGTAVDDGFTIQPGELGIYASRKASWKPANQRETFQNLGREAQAGGTLWLRSDSLTRHIAETDQVAMEGKLYEVLGIAEIGRREGVELLVAAADGQTEVDLTGLSPLPDANTTYTGWAAYVNTGPAQAIAANTDTRVENNAGTKIESQMPADVASLYDGTHVSGRVGDSIIVGTELTFTPDDGGASSLNLSIDIGGAVGKIYPRDFALVRGAGVAHKISYYPPAYTLDTWQANGGAITINVDGPGVVTGVRFVIHRLHKAR